MSRIKKRQKRERKLKNLIMLCIFTTIIVTTLTLSKYKSSIAGNSNAKVATPIINISAENPVIAVKINPIQSENIYEFSVSNIKDDKKSEVSMEYTIQIESLRNLPLCYELYRIEDENETEDLFEQNGDITETIQMNLEESKHTYKLKIKWKEDEQSYLYAQTIDYIQIKINSSQVD